MYSSLDSSADLSLSDDKEDYGFSNEGKGSEGGINEIYEYINLYECGGGSDIDSSVFSTVFYILIPLIFIFSVMKLIMKVS